MRKIKRLNISTELIDIKLLKETPVFYTELPKDIDVNKQVCTMVRLRKRSNKDSYVIIHKENLKLFSEYDKSSDIICNLHNASVKMVLLQYGLTYRVRTNNELQAVLPRLYTTVLDPCAGTGESTDMFDNAYLFDKDRECIRNLKARYKTRINEKEDDINGKESNS